MSKEQTCEERIDSRLESLADDIKCFMEGKPIDQDYDYDDDYDSLSEFCSYGLSFDAVEVEDCANPNCGCEGSCATNWDQPSVEYFRYQLSWGGPSSELRFYPTGKVRFYFMDWFDGAYRTVTNLDWVEWLVEQFNEMEMLRFKENTYHDVGYRPCY